MPPFIWFLSLKNYHIRLFTFLWFFYGFFNRSISRCFYRSINGFINEPLRLTRRLITN